MLSSNIKPKSTQIQTVYNILQTLWQSCYTKANILERNQNYWKYRAKGRIKSGQLLVYFAASTDNYVGIVLLQITISRIFVPSEMIGKQSLTLYKSIFKSANI